MNTPKSILVKDPKKVPKNRNVRFSIEELRPKQQVQYCSEEIDLSQGKIEWPIQKSGEKLILDTDKSFIYEKDESPKEQKKPEVRLIFNDYSGEKLPISLQESSTKNQIVPQNRGLINVAIEQPGRYAKKACSQVSIGALKTVEYAVPACESLTEALSSGSAKVTGYLWSFSRYYTE